MGARATAAHHEPLDIIAKQPVVTAPPAKLDVPSCGRLQKHETNSGFAPPTPITTLNGADAGTWPERELTCVIMLHGTRNERFACNLRQLSPKSIPIAAS